VIPIAYNNLNSRTDLQALIPEVVSDAMLSGLEANSAVLTMFPKIRMATNVTRMPILGALPTAYFVQGDTGLKQTTEMAWTNKYLNVEELAVIAPIPQNVFDDTSFNVWDNMRPFIEQAIGRVLDSAVFFGVNKPTSWPNSIAADAAAAANAVTRGTSTPALGGIAGDFSAAFGAVEQDGYDVTGIISNRTYARYLRDARDVQGRPLLDTNGSVYGSTLMYPMRGLWPNVVTTGSQNVETILGDFTQGLVGLRSDISLKILTESVIQDNTGAIILNLAQQDSIALRVTFRVAFQVKNSINYDNANASTRYPWAIINSPVHA
jgi:HK97 family phage major capsid protein